MLPTETATTTNKQPKKSIKNKSSTLEKRPSIDIITIENINFTLSSSPIFLLLFLRACVCVCNFVGYICFVESKRTYYTGKSCCCRLIRQQIAMTISVYDILAFLGKVYYYYCRTKDLKLFKYLLLILIFKIKSPLPIPLSLSYLFAQSRNKSKRTTYSM